jgi:hypothetical protein
MKKALLFLCISALICLQGCKKDYPDDIPDWLKDKIKELKKETKGNKNKCCAYVHEYPDHAENSSFYLVRNFEEVNGKNEPTIISDLSRMYDKDGLEICCFHHNTDDLYPPVGYGLCGLIANDSTRCGGGIGILQEFFENTPKNRTIWQEEE